MWFLVFETSALMGVRGFWLSAGARRNFEIINVGSENGILRNNSIVFRKFTWYIFKLNFCGLANSNHTKKYHH
jgi:hypothetical protein